jgi:hypothetical protein
MIRNKLACLVQKIAVFKISQYRSQVLADDNVMGGNAEEGQTVAAQKINTVQ